MLLGVVAMLVSMDVGQHTAPVTGLTAEVWRQVPDGMAVEIALVQHRIDRQDAALVAGTAAPVGHQLDWIALEDGAQRSGRQGTGRICTPVEEGVWHSGGDLAFYEPTRTQLDAVRARPGMLIIDGDPEIGALVSLAPGDTATVREFRRGGRLVRESVEVARATGRMRVERTPAGDRMCFVPG